MKNLCYPKTAINANENNGFELSAATAKSLPSTGIGITMDNVSERKILVNEIGNNQSHNKSYTFRREFSTKKRISKKAEKRSSKDTIRTLMAENSLLSKVDDDELDNADQSKNWHLEEMCQSMPELSNGLPLNLKSLTGLSKGTSQNKIKCCSDSNILCNKNNNNDNQGNSGMTRIKSRRAKNHLFNLKAIARFHNLMSQLKQKLKQNCRAENCETEHQKTFECASASDSDHHFESLHYLHEIQVFDRSTQMTPRQENMRNFYNSDEFGDNWLRFC